MPLDRSQKPLSLPQNTSAGTDTDNIRCTLVLLDRSQEPIAHIRWPSVMRQWLWPAAMLVIGGSPITSMATTPPALEEDSLTYNYIPSLWTPLYRSHVSWFGSPEHATSLADQSMFKQKVSAGVEHMGQRSSTHLNTGSAMVLNIQNPGSRWHLRALAGCGEPGGEPHTTTRPLAVSATQKVAPHSTATAPPLPASACTAYVWRCQEVSLNGWYCRNLQLSSLQVVYFSYEKAMW